MSAWDSNTVWRVCHPRMPKRFATDPEWISAQAATPSVCQQGVEGVWHLLVTGCTEKVALASNKNKSKKKQQSTYMFILIAFVYRLNRLKYTHRIKPFISLMKALFCRWMPRYWSARSVRSRSLWWGWEKLWELCCSPAPLLTNPLAAFKSRLKVKLQHGVLSPLTSLQQGLRFLARFLRPLVVALQNKRLEVAPPRLFYWDH